MFLPSAVSGRNQVFFRVLLTLCLAVGTFARAQEAAHELKLRWLPGSSYTLQTTTDTVTGLKALGQKEDQKMKVVQTTRVDVKEVGEANKEVRVEFSSVSGELVQKGRKKSFDSTKPEEGDSALRATLGRSIGSSFILLYDRDDRFTGVRDTGGMAPVAEGTPTLQGIVGSQEVADLFRRSLEMGLPKEAVKPGDRWTVQETVKFPSAGMVTVQLKARFDSIVVEAGNSFAKVVFEGTMKGVDDPVSRVRIAPGSTTAGQVYFDLTRKTVATTAFKADIQLEIDGKRVPVHQEVMTKLVSLSVVSN